MDTQRSLTDFETTIELVADEYGYNALYHTDFIVEFSDFDDTNLFRLVYDPSQQKIFILFHLNTRNDIAIMLFNRLFEISNGGIFLEFSYYETQDGTIFIGTDAEIARELDFAKIYNKEDSRDDDYKKLDPVSIQVYRPLYEANHKEAKDIFNKFKKSKRFFKKGD